MSSVNYCQRDVDLHSQGSDTPSTSCDTSAAKFRRMPTTASNVRGAWTAGPSRRKPRPGWLGLTVIETVCGCTSRNVVDDRPVESVTVRWTRYQTLADVSPSRG